MNVEQAKEKYLLRKLAQVEVMRSPEDKQLWFLTVRDKRMKAFLLVDEDEQVKIYSSLEEAVATIKDIGFKTALIHV